MCYSISNYLYLYHEYYLQTEIDYDANKPWKKFVLRNKKWYWKYFMNKKDKILNIVAIRKQIFKTFSWTISTKLEINYDRIKTLNSSMFWDNE